MPIAIASLITTPREARDLIIQVIEDNNDDLGFSFIGKDDERRLPGYPACVVSAGGKDREYHGTHTFNLRLACTVWVYHAAMDIGRAARSDEDWLMAEAIEDLLHADLTFNGAFISSYVEDVQPGLIQPRSQKSDMVISSRLLWVALSQERFK